MSSRVVLCHLQVFHVGELPVRVTFIPCSCCGSRGFRREVSLADATKKPIIPIVLERITWLPDGAMATAFTQVPLIQFNEDVGVQEDWQGAQFEELLGRIRMPIQPEKGKEAKERFGKDKIEKEEKHCANSNKFPDQSNTSQTTPEVKDHNEAKTDHASEPPGGSIEPVESQCCVIA